MTFLVITAGTSHSIIYSIKKNIFDFSDSVAIKSAIDGFFNTLSVKELNSTKNIIEIYPNPTNGILNLKLESKNTTNAREVSIYNSFGALVRKEDLIFKNNTASINTNELPNGVYELSLEDGVSKRFVIAR
jgi:methionine salvage enolase-phosphatase E1